MADDERVRIPVNLYDLFYARRSTGAPTRLVAVIGCLGGGLDAVIGDDVAGLPPSLLAQIEAIQVGRRHRLRAIAAEEISFLALEAVQQRARISGYNDPLRLHCAAPIRLMLAPGTARIERGDSPATVAIGRLDLLHALEACGEDRLEHPAALGTTIHHLLLPIGRADALAQGRGIALVYPGADDPNADHPDNTSAILTLAHDSLARLQEDLRRETPGHPVARMTLPTPSRALLEERLGSQGYRIEGDTAYRLAGQAPGDVSDGASPGAWLRGVAAWWLEPRLPLPPQATLADYQRIIREALPAVVTTADAAIRDALIGRVQRGMAPIEEPRLVQAAPFAQQVASPNGPGPPRSPAGGGAGVGRPSRGVSRRAARPPHRDFDADFKPGPAPRPAPLPHAEWADDFASGGATPAGQPDAGTPGAPEPQPPDFDADFADVRPAPRRPTP